MNHRKLQFEFGNMPFAGGLKKVICLLAAVVILIFSGQPIYGRKSCHMVKNIIVMISDGCGYNHVDAASLYQYGRTGVQVYEQFPVRLGMSTYAAGQTYKPGLAWKYFNYVSDSTGYTDSAAAATAMSTGVKTYKEAIGVDLDRHLLTHIVEVAEQKGKATGVITSVQLSHATPAGFVAHNESRNNYEQIAKQMIYKSCLEVIMGCGHPYYDDDGMPITNKKKEYKYVGGESIWDDLKDGSVTGSDADGDGKPDEWVVIDSRVDFQAMMVGPTPKRVIGIPRKHTTLQHARGGDKKAEPFAVPYNGDVPTLAEMTKAALNVLDNDTDGFFLMIEGGAIDWASHNNQIGRLIEEQIDFNKAVEAVLQWIVLNSSWSQTLLIVTADHECGYLTGPKSGISQNGPVWNPLIGRGIGKVPDVEWHSTKHTNALIPFYARGAGSQLFKRRAQNRDTVRSFYLDNTSIAKVVFSLLGHQNADEN